MSRPPSVLCLITQLRASSGLGGHFHSLRDVARALLPHLRLGLACLGWSPPPPLFDGLFEAHFIDERRGPLSALRALLRLTKAGGYEVIHSYDPAALTYARVIASVAGVRLVHTQCGGPNPRRIFPVAGDLICFSRENRDFYQAQPRMRGTRIHLLPNRARPVAPRPERVEALRRRGGVGPGELVLLRVNRMIPHYELSSQQLITLCAALRARDLPARCLIVGTPNDPAVVARLRAREGPHVQIITEPAFTELAAEQLECGDVILGTGRGFMEACSLGKVMLTTVADRSLPTLVTAESLAGLAYSNFSPRNQTSLSDPELQAQIEQAVGDPDALAEAGRFAREAFERHFSVENVVPDYLRIYRTARRPGHRHLPRAAAWLTTDLATRQVRALLARQPRPR